MIIQLQFSNFHLYPSLLLWRCDGSFSVEHGGMMRTSAMSCCLRDLFGKRGKGGPIHPLADPPQHGLNWPLPFPRCFLSVKMKIKIRWIYMTCINLSIKDIIRKKNQNHHVSSHLHSNCGGCLLQWRPNHKWSLSILSKWKLGRLLSNGKPVLTLGIVWEPMRVDWLLGLWTLKTRVGNSLVNPLWLGLPRMFMLWPSLLLGGALVRPKLKLQALRFFVQRSGLTTNMVVFVFSSVFMSPLTSLIYFTIGHFKLIYLYYIHIANSPLYSNKTGLTIALAPLQVQALRCLCALPKDASSLQADAWGLKKLFSYACRKSGYDKDLSSSPSRRATQQYTRYRIPYKMLVTMV